MTRAKRIPEWTTYDKEVAELAQRLLKKENASKGKENGDSVDESMFVQIDSSSPKEPVADEAKGEIKPGARVKEEL